MRTRTLARAIGAALHAPALPPLGRSDYERIRPDIRPALRFRLQPGLTLIDTGRICVRRRRGSVVVEWLPAAAFAFLAALQRGAPLCAAADAAAADDPAYDVVAAITQLLVDGAVVSVAAQAALRAA